MHFVREGIDYENPVQIMLDLSLTYDLPHSARGSERNIYVQQGRRGLPMCICTYGQSLKGENKVTL